MYPNLPPLCLARPSVTSFACNGQCVGKGQGIAGAKCCGKAAICGTSAPHCYQAGGDTEPVCHSS